MGSNDAEGVNGMGHPKKMNLYTKTMNFHLYRLNLKKHFCQWSAAWEPGFGLYAKNFLPDFKRKCRSEKVGQGRAGAVVGTADIRSGRSLMSSGFLQLDARAESGVKRSSKRRKTHLDKLVRSKRKRRSKAGKRGQNQNPAEKKLTSPGIKFEEISFNQISTFPCNVNGVNGELEMGQPVKPTTSDSNEDVTTGEDQLTSAAGLRADDGTTNVDALSADPAHSGEAAGCQLSFPVVKAPVQPLTVSGIQTAGEGLEKIQMMRDAPEPSDGLMVALFGSQWYLTRENDVQTLQERLTKLGAGRGGGRGGGWKAGRRRD